MQIFVLGNGVKYIDATNEVDFTTAKGNITPIKISDNVVAFKNPVTPQKSFDVSNILKANGDTYGATADEVIEALSSLVFKTEGGGIPTTPGLTQIITLTTSQGENIGVMEFVDGLLVATNIL